MNKLLNKLGYRIKNGDGKQFFGWNIFDIVCLSVYTCISFSNLFASSPSVIIWVLNLTILGRIIARNKIEVKELEKNIKKVESIPRHFYFFVNWHTKKLIAEITSGIGSLAVLAIGITCEFRFGVVDHSFRVFFFFLGAFIIFLSFVEDLLKIIEKIYSAELPLQNNKREA